jgi:NAD(P)-dependent dehydrogenase (short-subunit alcohol dehydrogenase family)
MATPSTLTPGARRGAVVTGGGGGLGVATARELAAMGYRVWLADVDLDAARRGRDTIGEPAVATHLDVTDAAACRALAAEVEAEAGLALWVNGAGILRTGPSWELSAADTALLFDVNVHGTVHGTAAALEVFRRVGRGQVVNVISLAGLTAPPGETMYAATKHAALAYTLGTAQDLRLHGHEGIHLSAVCPDGIWTPMLYDHVADPQAALSWSGVLLTPERAAAAIATVVRRPRPVLSVPRWRGGVARVAATMPRLALRTMPQVMAQARRKQAAFRATLSDRQRPRRPRSTVR